MSTVIPGSANVNLGDWASKSHTPNGYQKLPGGLIIQWGKLTTTASAGQVVSFPIQFPTACLSVQVTSSNSSENFTVAAYTQTVNGFLTKTQNASSGAMAAGQIDWFAIGY